MTTIFPQRQLGPFQVSAIGLGCMNLSHAYGAPVSAEQGERVLLAALDAGVTHFDTAALYGFGANESLVGRVLSQHRSRFTLASKCGMTGVDLKGDGQKVRVIDGRPLKARQLVGVRGAGLAYDGLYYVNSVTSTLKRGEFRQSFQLTRNGLVSITPKVPV